MEGVLKKVTREGSGWATPKDADQVSSIYHCLLYTVLCILRFYLEFAQLLIYECTQLCS